MKNRITTLGSFALLIVHSLILFNDARGENLEVYTPQPYIQIEHPEWSKNAIIYQINTRQFTQEGTFAAAETHLPRLKALGVDILWLMPIHPIGALNRKGTLGSPYSVKDYFGVNPEFGTLDDLKHFVNAAHEAGMHVILDWVANHTAWDNVIKEAHPNWYERKWNGDFRPTPWWDWSDIIDLNYEKPELRAYMTRAMRYWVEEADIDGYRCDVAGFVPVDFWNQVRKELDAIKPVFMLAEWESRDLHAKAFDMTYAWSWHEKMVEIAHGKADVMAMFVYYSWNESAFPKDAYRMTCVSNHDMNAWEGTQFETFGDALEATIVLSVVGEGFPMIYNGQEAGNPKRLEFFEKDEIKWRDHPVGELYRKLITLQHNHTALWHGKYGATMIHVPNSVPTKVLSFVREDANDKVLALLNLSNEAQEVTLEETLYLGDYQDFFSGEPEQLTPESKFSMPAWSYRVFVR